MSNRLFQSVIHQMKDAVDNTIGVIDEGGAIIACTDLSKVGEQCKTSASDVLSSAVAVTIGDETYHAFGNTIKPEYAVFVAGTDDSAKKAANLIAVALGSIKQYYDEKYDRANFIKNVMLDNYLPGDIFIKSNELHLNTDSSRVVLLLRICDTAEVSVYELVCNLFPDKNKDFVINVSETDIALVKDVRDDIEAKDLEKLASSIADSLNAQFHTNTHVGIGTVVTGIKDIARSFREAGMALEVGKVFDTEKTIISYENLGIARLIYQIPDTVCVSFLKEIFKRGPIETLDAETLFTIQKFFENNLNVSETSRKLFVHRNTLVYRLEKIRKLTGLDLREFDDAIVFKIALMVKKYLDSKPQRL